MLIFDPNFFAPKASVIRVHKVFEIVSTQTMYFMFYLMGSFCAASCKELLSSWKNCLRNIQLIVDPNCLHQNLMLQHTCNIWSTFVAQNQFIWYVYHYIHHLIFLVRWQAGFWARFWPIFWKSFSHTLIMFIWPKVYEKMFFF